jgi:hypothetical protein
MASAACSIEGRARKIMNRNSRLRNAPALPLKFEPRPVGILTPPRFEPRPVGVLAFTGDRAVANGPPCSGCVVASASFMYDRATPDAMVKRPWGMPREVAVDTIWSLPNGTPLTLLGPERADGARFWPGAAYVPVRIEAASGGFDPGTQGFVLSGQIARVSGG